MTPSLWASLGLAMKSAGSQLLVSVNTSNNNVLAVHQAPCEVVHRIRSLVDSRRLPHETEAEMIPVSQVRKLRL